MPPATPLLSPATLADLALPNRLVMAPMTRMRAEPDGTPSALMVEYYAQRASAGLVVVEATAPDVAGRTFAGTPGIYTDRQVAGWRGLTDRVHDAGGRLFLQLQHGGRIGHPRVSGSLPLAPSAVALPDVVHTADGPLPAPVPREMSVAEIGATVDAFARAAERAVVAGFDGVEVHGANGFLLHQFLARNTNLRDDEYGGPVAHRARLLLEVTRAVVARIGAARVGVRIAPGFTGYGIDEGDTPDIYRHLVPALAGTGAAYLHIVFAEPGVPSSGRRGRRGLAR